VKKRYSYPRLSLAFALGLIAVIVLIFFIFPNLGIYNEITNAPHSRNFQVTFSVYLNNTINIELPDVIIGLNVTYPNGTLVVDEPVTIFGKAVLNTPQAKNIGNIAIAFDNAYEFPQSYDSHGIQKFVTLNINNPNNEDELLGHINLSWPIDGDYRLIGYIIFYDGSLKSMNNNNVVFHVYPKEQLTQIQSNKISLVLTIVLLIFTYVGIIDIILRLLEKKPNNLQEIANKNDNDKYNSEINNKASNHQTVRNPNQKTNKHNRQSKKH
jgi:hypothetical protein